MKKLGSNFALGDGKYPETVEDAVQVLALNEPKNPWKKGKDKGPRSMEVSFGQFKGVCWKCGEEGHTKQNCPLNKNKADKEEKEEAHNQVVKRKVKIWSC